MDASRLARAGAVLLVLGGLLEAASYAIGSLIGPPDTTLPGVGLLVGYAIGSITIGLGLIATGAAFRNPERPALIVAGLVSLTIPVLDTVQMITDAPFGPAPSQFAYLLFLVATVLAALTLLRNVELPPGVRWSLTVPAACFLLTAISLYVPLPAIPGTIVLPWAGVAAAGVMLLRSSSRGAGPATDASPS